MIAVNCVAREADFGASVNIVFTIEENRNNEINISSNTEIIYTFLTEESTKVNIFPVTERFYAPISEIEGSYAKRKGFRFIDKINKSWTYDSSPNVFSSDYKTYRLNFKDQKKIGEEIKITYHEKFWEPAYLPVIEIISGERIDSYIFEFNHPADFEITYETFFPRKEFKNKIYKANNKNTVITFNNLFEEDELDFFGYNGIYAMVFFRIFKDGEEITPFNLKNYVNWYCQKVDTKPGLSKEHNNLLRSEIEQVLTNEEKLKIIYENVRDNFRYIASNENNHSFFPHEIDIILQNGYGDCKDKAYLLKAIAAHYGLKVDLVLLHSDIMPKKDYYNFSLYDHMICSYADSTGILFMDPTSKYCEFGNLPYTDYEKHALILDNENPRQEWIPKPNIEYDTILEIDAKVDSLKRCKARITLHNDDYMYAKSLYENYQGLEFENQLSNFLTSYYYKISLDYFKFVEETENNIVFNAKADLTEFVISTETRKYLQRTPFVVFDKNILERSEDNYDLHVNGTFNLKLLINLDTNNYKINPQELLIGNADKDYFNSVISKGDGHYVLEYKFNNLNMNYGIEEKQGLIDFIRKYMKNKKNMIVLNKEEK